MKQLLYCYVITILVVSACSSGKNTFEHGNYYDAVITSVSRLRRNNDHKKSIETLRQSYPLAITFYKDRATSSLATNHEFRWNAVVDSYTAINTMYDEIKRCPGALAVIPDPLNFFSKLQEARQNAAEEHYAAGLAAMQLANREKSKQAYVFFQNANRLVSGYKDVTKKMEDALWGATVKVVVEPIPAPSRNVGVSAEFFNDKISEYVHTSSINEFVRFFSRGEAQKLKLSPDHIVQLTFDDFTVGQVLKQEKESQVSKDSMVVGTYLTASNGDKQTEYRKITNLTGGNGLVVSTGNDAIITTTQNNSGQNTNSTAESNAANLKADKERADKLKADAEREMVERLKADKEKTDKENADRAIAEKLKAEKEMADREIADKLKADRERGDRELAERLKADKESTDRAIAEKLKADKEKADKEIADKLKADKEKADKELAEKLKAERENADREIAEKLKADKEKTDKELAERLKADKEDADKAIAAKLKADKERADKETADKLKSDQEKADKELAEQLKAERENADRAIAAKLKAEKEKYEDPTINKEDTTDVKDPVTICHTPPGKEMKHKTLVISRSALKAHLGHGDSEGNCGVNNKGQKDNQQENNKNENGGKPSGSGRNEKFNDYNFDEAPILIASMETDNQKFLRYFNSFIPVAGMDTNKVYATVKATLHQYKKTTTSKGTVSFKIIDAKTGALLSVEKMPGEFVWISEWATFNGDERALSPEQFKLTQQKEQVPPPPQELFIGFTKPIYDQITSKIRDFYKGY